MSEQPVATEVEVTQRDDESIAEFEQRAWARVQSSPPGTVVTSTYDFGDIGGVIRDRREASEEAATMPVAPISPDALVIIQHPGESGADVAHRVTEALTAAMDRSQALATQQTTGYAHSVSTPLES